MRRLLPHHLRKVASSEGALRLVAESVFAHLVVPRPANGLRIGLGVAIGRPETVDVLAVRRIRTIGEAIFTGQRFGPVLRQEAQLVVESV